jgi:Ca-activated chloride channel family protein
MGFFPDISNFHFLRPAWLLLLPLALAIHLLWRRHADPVAQWRRTIAPHLLNALLVGAHSRFRIRPIHAVTAALMLCGIAVAGPTWTKEKPPLTADLAPMVVAIDLSPSMDATDIAPTRLARVKQKVRDLAVLRRGARTGLVVYAGTAHTVVPPTEDPELLQIFLNALATNLMPAAGMPVRGKNAAAALAEAEHLLGKEDAPGTVLFFSDGFDTSQTSAFEKVSSKGIHQILMIAVGTEGGGPLKSSDGGVVVDAVGRPVTGSFDGAALKRMSSEADIPLASLTLDNADMEWVQRRAQKHLQQVEDADSELRWKESGYWLTFPIALLALFAFRRGWVVRWGVNAILAGAIAVSLLHPVPASAAAFDTLHPIDLFLTPDQQGRWHFERGEYAQAAAHFQDPLWKGLAYTRAGQYQAALGEFARLDSPAAYFEMGNCYARLQHYPEAVKAYDLALQGQKDFPQASANRALVLRLIASQKKDESEEGTTLKPDQIKWDNKHDKGKETQVTAQQETLDAETWMRNLQTSPADFLREKFRIEAAASGAAVEKSEVQP